MTSINHNSIKIYLIKKRKREFIFLKSRKLHKRDLTFCLFQVEWRKRNMANYQNRFSAVTDSRGVWHRWISAEKAPTSLPMPSCRRPSSHPDATFTPTYIRARSALMISVPIMEHAYSRGIAIHATATWRVLPDRLVMMVKEKKKNIYSAACTCTCIKREKEKRLSLLFSLENH